MLETVTQSTGDFQVDPDFYFWLDSPIFNVPYPWTVDVSGRLPGELLLEKKKTKMHLKLSSIIIGI